MDTEHDHCNQKGRGGAGAKGWRWWGRSVTLAEPTKTAERLREQRAALELCFGWKATRLGLSPP